MTIEEFRQIYGENFMDALSNNVSVPSPSKPIIYSFNDLDNATKSIFQNLYNLLTQKNPGYNFFLFVVGKRVIGKWRSQEEVNEINSINNTDLQVSPYEFCTDAPELPNEIELSNISPIIELTLNCSNDTHSIIVPPPANE